VAAGGGNVTSGSVLDAGLVALVLTVAAWSILARDAWFATIAFVVYGLLAALVWVRLSAVDVALTEAAIGSGITGMLLLGAAARLRPTEAGASSPGAPLCIATGVFCALIAAGLAATALLLPDPAPTLAPAVMTHLPESGLGNPVTGVLFVYRALDTLLEKVVLLLALVAVWSLAPNRFWGGSPRLALYPRSHNALVFLAQLLPPFGLLIGIYMFWAGADYPGGAFQGGAVLAAMWLLVMIASLQDAPDTSWRWLRLLLVVGPVVFLAIGCAGFVLAGAFLAYPAGYAKPLIIAAEAALTLSIGVTLGLLAAGPPERMPHWAERPSATIRPARTQSWQGANRGRCRQGLLCGRGPGIQRSALRP
jgi:multisubunit Na+/H+ antiporter MnhB subunit